MGFNISRSYILFSMVKIALIFVSLSSWFVHGLKINAMESSFRSVLSYRGLYLITPNLMSHPSNYAPLLRLLLTSNDDLEVIISSSCSKWTETVIYSVSEFVSANLPLGNRLFTPDCITELGTGMVPKHWAHFLKLGILAGIPILLTDYYGMTNFYNGMMRIDELDPDGILRYGYLNWYLTDWNVFFGGFRKKLLKTPVHRYISEELFSIAKEFQIQLIEFLGEYLHENQEDISVIAKVSQIISKGLPLIRRNHKYTALASMKKVVTQISTLQSKIPREPHVDNSVEVICWQIGNFELFRKLDKINGLMAIINIKLSTIGNYDFIQILFALANCKDKELNGLSLQPAVQRRLLDYPYIRDGYDKIFKVFSIPQRITYFRRWNRGISNTQSTIISLDKVDRKLHLSRPPLIINSQPAPVAATQWIDALLTKLDIYIEKVETDNVTVIYFKSICTFLSAIIELIKKLVHLIVFLKLNYESSIELSRVWVSTVVCGTPGVSPLQDLVNSSLHLREGLMIAYNIADCSIDY